MLWRKMDFETALLRMKEEFDEEPEAERLALVWREGGEYNVLPTWLLPHFKDCLDWEDLVVVMCLSRKELIILWEMIKEGVE
jgi:hypothetical protein